MSRQHKGPWRKKRKKRPSCLLVLPTFFFFFFQGRWNGGRGGTQKKKFRLWNAANLWNDRSISPSSKTQLMRSLVTSIFLYACKSWSLTAELQRRIQAMEMRCYCKILHISYKDHVTNEEVRAKSQQAKGSYADSLTIVKRCKLQWYGHVSRSSGLAKDCKAQ